MSSTRPIQVDPLPLSSGSGGASSQTQKEMEKTNTTLTMLLAQSTADATYDPAPPSTVTQPSIREAFCSGDPRDSSYMLVAVAIAFMIYGIVSK
jgi:hypothetical protein